MWPFSSPIEGKTKEQLRAEYYRASGDGQRRIIRALRKQCAKLRHDFTEPQAVFSSGGMKGADELGNRIAFHIRKCQRCGLEQPVSEEDARYKAAMDASFLALIRQYRGPNAPMPENFESPF